MKRVVLTGLLMLAGAALAQKNPDTLTVLTSADWSGFDPAYCYDTACGDIIQNTTETLFFPDGANPGRFVPLLAAEIPTVANGGISRDGRTYTIKLRPNLKFSDGTPLTAEDVEYSFERMMVYSADTGAAGLINLPLLGSPELVRKGGKIGYAQIDRAVEARDRNTVVFTLPKAFTPFISVLAFSTFSVVSKNAAIKGGDWSGTARDWERFNNLDNTEAKFRRTGLLGSGPFVIERYDEGKTVVLRRNTNYWRAPAKLARVIIQNVPDDTTRIQMLRTGDADMVHRNSIPEAQLPNVQSIPGIKVTNSPSLAMTVFNMNVKINGTGSNVLGSGRLDGRGIPANFFSDKNLRKAFAYAFDYNTYIREVLRGNAIQPSGVMIRGMPGYNASDPKYKYDPALAERYFKAAWGGRVWQNGFVLPVYWNTGNTRRQRALELLKRNVEALNPKFRIDVREVPFSQYSTLQADHRMSMNVAGWQLDYADPYNMAEAWLIPDGYYGRSTQYNNPRIAALVEQGVGESDTNKRLSLYRQAHRLAFDDVAMIPIYQLNDIYIQRDYVKGRIINPIFSQDYYYPISK
ncbi:peptide/nickel transport system substrate-binding protein [Deinobacterium chartae]|uniref:Peptide/nickel transport system substrate-binding protein n=1 Tax=Deinobacterium chartae TaxID=521158 RepID=A0A841I4B7_9DEIO|nr:ABC transporter substrate-binding protein [Deinobacterium chartae]MBB6099884.1 peptide/nickel transport system substrate-binding protein [Deinobacterium chartae]